MVDCRCTSAPLCATKRSHCWLFASESSVSHSTAGLSCPPAAAIRWWANAVTTAVRHCMNSLSVDCTRSMPVERCGVLFTLCLDYKVIIEKKCASGRGIDAKCLFSHTSQKSSIKSSTLSLTNSQALTCCLPHIVVVKQHCVQYPNIARMDLLSHRARETRTWRVRSRGGEA